MLNQLLQDLNDLFFSNKVPSISTLRIQLLFWLKFHQLHCLSLHMKESDPLVRILCIRFLFSCVTFLFPIFPRRVRAVDTLSCCKQPLLDRWHGFFLYICSYFMLTGKWENNLLCQGFFTAKLHWGGTVHTDCERHSVVLCCFCWFPHYFFLSRKNL